MNDFLDNLGANQYRKMHKTSKKMINPISVVKNTRMSYNKFLDKNVKEVEVQFKNEDPAWIPYDTLLSMMEWEMEVKRG